MSHAVADAIVFSKSFARRLFRLSHAILRSTIQRRGNTIKLFAAFYILSFDDLYSLFAEVLKYLPELVACIIAARASGGRSFHALAVNHPGTGRRLATSHFSSDQQQGMIECKTRTIVAPQIKLGSGLIL